MTDKHLYKMIHSGKFKNLPEKLKLINSHLWEGIISFISRRTPSIYKNDFSQKAQIQPM